MSPATKRLFASALALFVSTICFPHIAAARQSQSNPAAAAESALTDALSAACREDETEFATFLTAENAAAYRALPAPQRTAVMKRFVLLDEPGKPLLSTSNSGHSVIRCQVPAITTEMRMGAARVHDNLAFIPMEIPVAGDEPRSIQFGLVREDGNWKLLSLGLVLLDVPALAKEWERADLEAGEALVIAALRKIADALQSYRGAFGKLPETLIALGPAPAGGISPEAGGFIDAELASGSKYGYAFRYRIVPPSGAMTHEEEQKNAGFQLAAVPVEYGKSGKRSFYLDSSGILRAADKKGAVATAADPPVGPS